MKWYELVEEAWRVARNDQTPSHRTVQVITPEGVYEIDDVVYSAGKVFIRCVEKAGV